MNSYMGIDPGKSGGYALVTENSYECYPWDDTEFAKFCREHTVTMCCVEKVGAMPKQGVTSTFNFGKSAGFIEGVLTVCGIPYQLITPQKWKKEFLLNNDKAKSITVCKQLFPNVNLKRTERCKNDHDGMAEALLMAVYAKRKL